jgi:hypothetical protein
VQNFCGAAAAQLYGVLADGTTGPLMAATAISGLAGLAAGLAPFLAARKAASLSTSL